jgi:thiol-disulfide isomerase/thioredoxin
MLKQLSYSMSAKEMLDELATLSAEMQAWPMVVKMKENSERKLKTEPQVEGSDYVPYYIDIVQPNINGEAVSLKSVVENKHNRYVLLNFWASWWRPSEGEAPMLKKAYSLYHKKGFEIYGVSLDRRKESLREGIKELGVVWPTVCSYEEYASSAVEAYAIDPKELSNFLIDGSNGVIIAKNLRGEELLSKLSELLK